MQKRNAKPTPPRSDKKVASSKPRPPQPTRPDRREIKYHGINACLAIWRQRPQDIIRVYLLEANIPRCTEFLKWVAAQRKAYHIVGNDDLEKLTESIHHQGICVLALEPAPMRFDDLKRALDADKGPQLLAFLDGVENPHNVGAILRTCAHFDVRFLLVEARKLSSLSASACRIAEGGAEHVALIGLVEPITELKVLQKLGFRIAATSVTDGDPVYSHSFRRKTLLAMGAEQIGVSRATRKIADANITIPGTELVESLNVSAAFAVFAGEYFRQRHFGVATNENTLHL